MKALIKKEVIENYLKENNMSKNKFSKNCYISVKTFDKFMRGELIELFIALKVAEYMKLEYKDLFEIK